MYRKNEVRITMDKDLTNLLQLIVKLALLIGALVMAKRRRTRKRHVKRAETTPKPSNLSENGSRHSTT